MKKLLYGVLCFAFVLLLSPQIGKATDFWGVPVPIDFREFTEEVHYCKSEEFDIELFSGRDISDTTGVVLYKRNKARVALIEYWEREFGGWELIEIFLVYPDEIGMHGNLPSDEEIIETYFGDELMRKISSWFQRECLGR